jgi:hypothetical protein
LRGQDAAAGPPQEGPVRPRVAILGSCVSRDIFNFPDAQARFEVVDYYARSSLASLVSKPWRTPVPLERIESAFQRRMVARDFAKSLFTELDLSQVDVLLIDLVDERFDLFLGPEGTAFTISPEFQRAGVALSELDGRTLRATGDEAFSLWTTGWQRLLAWAEAAGAADRILVNQVYWSERTESGEGFGPRYAPSAIQSANAYLDRLYRRMAEDLLPGQFAKFDPSLLRGDDGHRWGKQPFHFVPGYYAEAAAQIARFARDRPPAARPPARPARTPAALHDYARWQQPLHDHASLTTALKADIGRTPGLHRIAIGRDRLDVLVQPGEGGPAGEPPILLVGFAGAVSDRRAQRPPFFAGTDMAASLGLPLLAFSDPTLGHDATLRLAWYAGSRSTPDLPDRIAELLDGVAASLGARLLLFGGSGGGYAVLSLLPRLKAAVAALAWNPQTAISQHDPAAVADFLRVAAPEAHREHVAAASAAGEPEAERLKRALAQAGLPDRVPPWRPRPGQHLLYLQNRSGVDAVRHAGPYLRELTLHRCGPRSFATPDGSLAAWFGDWGQSRHAAPPSEVLAALLRSLAAAEPDVAGTAARFDLEHRGSGPAFSLFQTDGFAADGLRATARRSGSGVEATIASDAGDWPPGTLFAFYLLRGGRRIASRWYTAEPSVRFDDPGGEGLQVMAFARDELGAMITTTTPPLA